MNQFIKSALQRVRAAVVRRGYEIHPIERECWRDQVRMLEGLNVEQIMDVGANHGAIADQYMAMFPSARVHCVEALPELAELLRKKPGNRVVHEFAAAAAPGVATFHVNSLLDTSSLLASDLKAIPASYRPLLAERRAIDVRCTTIDSLCEQQGLERLSILKLDIQGGERDALLGARAMLAQDRIDVVYTEVYFLPYYVGQPLFGEISALLDCYGYRLHMLYNLVISGSTGRLQSADALFVSPRLAERSADLLRSSLGA